MKLKDNKGFTGVDIAVSTVIIMIFVSIISTMFYNLAVTSKKIERKTTATNLAIQTIEAMKIIDFDELAETITINEINNLIENKIEIPNGYDMEVGVDNKKYPDVIKIISAQVNYQSGKNIENVKIETLVKKVNLINDKTYKINYDANGGSKAPTSQNKKEGADLTLSSEIPTRIGYTFLGWSTNANAAIAEYLAGGQYLKNEEVTLYAVWKENIGIYVALNGTTLSFFRKEIAAREYADSTSHYYGNIEGDDYQTQNKVPWYSIRKSIKTVNFVDTIQPTSTAYWFYECEQLTSIQNITNLDTGNVFTMKCMFKLCSSLTNLNLSKFDTSKVTTMQEMFYYCSSLTSLDVSKFNTSKVTDMSRMFYECSRISTLNLSNFNTSKVTTMQEIFAHCTSLTNLDISSFNTSNVTNMFAMFYNCSLTDLDLRNFNTSKVTTMKEMFSRCHNLKNLNISVFDTSKVTDMSGMFFECYEMANFNLSNFNTSNVTTMKWMFNHCWKLTNLNLSSFNTSKVTDMNEMFNDCIILTSIDIRSFDTRSATDMSSMFKNCILLKNIYVGTYWVTTQANTTNMFTDCGTNSVTR